ncbi:MAG: RNase H family protein, partial [Culicoidibacterales bacterium]
MNQISISCDASWNHQKKLGSIAAILFDEEQKQVLQQALHVESKEPVDVFELEQLAAVLGIYMAVQIGKTKLDVFYDNHLVEPKELHKKTTVKAEINQQYHHEIKTFKQQNINLDFHKIKAHTSVEKGGDLLNKQADQLATLAANPKNAYPKLVLKTQDVPIFFGQITHNEVVNVTIVTYLLKQHPFFSRFSKIIIGEEVIQL